MGNIKTKCPHCGAPLTFANASGIEHKRLSCPVCKGSFRFFKRIEDNNRAEEPTEYPGESPTRINEEMNYTLGQLKVSLSGVPVFRLKIGKNLIGRKSANSIADFQIPITESKRLSREHLVIDVKKVPGKGFVHYASLYKQQINATFISGERLAYGDCVILKHGDILNLPDISVRFEIPDEEETDV